MNASEFAERFGQATLLGRFIFDGCILSFHDNGTDVGVWREQPGPRSCRGEILPHSDEMAARVWWWQQASNVLDLSTTRPAASSTAVQPL